MKLAGHSTRDDMLAFPCFSISGPIMVIECKFPFSFLGSATGRNIKDVPTKALHWHLIQNQSQLCRYARYPVLCNHTHRTSPATIHPAGGLDEPNGPPVGRVNLEICTSGPLEINGPCQQGYRIAVVLSINPI